MKILYMITLPELGGAQTNVLDLICGFHLHHDVCLATSAEGPLTDSVKKLGVPIYLVPTLGRAINLMDDFSAVQQCIDLFKSVKPDLIHLHSSKAGLIGRIAARRLSIPVVFTAHGWGFKPGVPPLRRWIVWASEALVAPLAEHLICVSKYDEQLARNYFVGRSKQRNMIHYGISPDALPATPELNPAKIIMVARFQEPKEQSLLIKAFASIQANDDVQLQLVGSGPYLSANQDLAQNLGINHKIQFLGDRTDVPKLLAEAQIFVLLSRYEGLPISILEAMRSGLPIITSSVGGTPEEIEHEKTGFLVPSGNVELVARYLKFLLDNPNLRKQMGDAGRKKFLKEFTIERMLAQTERVYAQISPK